MAVPYVIIGLYFFGSLMSSQQPISPSHGPPHVCRTTSTMLMRVETCHGKTIRAPHALAHIAPMTYHGTTGCMTPTTSSEKAQDVILDGVRQRNEAHYQMYMMYMYMICMICMICMRGTKKIIDPLYIIMVFDVVDVRSVIFSFLMKPGLMMRCSRCKVHCLASRDAHFVEYVQYFVIDNKTICATCHGHTPAPVLP